MHAQNIEKSKMYEINPETIRILSIALHELSSTQLQGPAALRELSKLIKKHMSPVACAGSPALVPSEDTEPKQSTPRVILVLGGPGSGKGTLCDCLVSDMGFGHVSVGDCLRTEVASGSALGKEVDAIMQSGRLVSDDLAIQVVTGALANHKASRILLDGFPRTVEQATQLEEQVCSVSKVFWLACEDESVLINRILARGRASGRVDDNAESVAERLKTFKENTTPILEYFKGRNDGKLVLVDASLSPSEVLDYVKGHLDGL